MKINSNQKQAIYSSKISDICFNLIILNTLKTLSIITPFRNYFIVIFVICIYLYYNIEYLGNITKV